MKIFFLLLCMIFTLNIYADHHLDINKLSPAIVLKVKRADTILVLYAGRKKLVRLAGVRLFSSLSLKRMENSVSIMKSTTLNLHERASWSYKALNYINKRIKKGSAVWLEFEKNNPLKNKVYVYLGSAKYMLNAMLLRNGLARLNQSSQLTHKDYFKKQQLLASSENKGYWLKH